MHRVPHYTAWLLLSLLAAALLTGLLDSERSFCALCPVSPLLSVYSRFAPLQLTSHNRRTCETCEGKECVRATSRHQILAGSCPSSLRPYQLSPSDGCVSCFRCVHICPHDNLGLGIRPPVRQPLRPFEAAFVIIATGFVMHELVGEVAWLDHYFHLIPQALDGVFPSLGFHWFEALWFLLLFPLYVWTVIVAVGYHLGEHSRLRHALLAATLSAAPIVAIAHLAKGAAKISSWVGFLPGAIGDPRGLDTFEQLYSLPADTNVSRWLLGWLMVTITVLVGWRRYNQVSLSTARSALATTMLLFCATLLLWAT